MPTIDLDEKQSVAVVLGLMGQMAKMTNSLLSPEIMKRVLSVDQWLDDRVHSKGTRAIKPDGSPLTDDELARFVLDIIEKITSKGETK